MQIGYSLIRMFQKIQRWLNKLRKPDTEGKRYTVLSSDTQNPGVRCVHGHKTRFYRKACNYAKRLSRNSSMDKKYWIEDETHKVLVTYQGRLRDY